MQELGAVMNRFDKDEDGTVDVVEFTKMFFKMGFDERTKRTKERRDAEAVRTEGKGGDQAHGSPQNANEAGSKV